MTQRTVLVVPCFNEARRLAPEGFVELLADPRVELLFVDDGSTDDTLAVLQRFAAAQPRASVLSLARNAGKAEAVRQGLSAALERAPFGVGFTDADLATPPSELQRLLRVLYERDVEVVLASRVALLGRQIDRTPARHYLGRVFATLAAAALSIPVYDTQCGAKLFRATPALAAALAEPFISRWGFDIELIGRLVRGGGGAAGLPIDRFHEEPLKVWNDVAGSKLRATHMARTLYELGQIARALRRRG